MRQGKEEGNGCLDRVGGETEQGLLREELTSGLKSFYNVEKENGT